MNTPTNPTTGEPIDLATILQAVLAVMITVGCFASYFVYQTTPEWAVQLLVLVYGFFFGSRFGANTQRAKNVNNYGAPSK